MALDAAGTCDPAGPTERAACEASAGGSGAFTLDLTGERRARPRCRFVTPLIHFIPELLAYSVPLLLKRQCGRTLGGPRGARRGAAGGARRGRARLRHAAALRARARGDRLAALAMGGKVIGAHLH